MSAIKSKTDSLPAQVASQTEVVAIKSKTDNLPIDPADQLLVEAHVTSEIKEMKQPVVPCYDREEDSLAKIGETVRRILTEGVGGGKTGFSV